MPELEVEGRPVSWVRDGKLSGRPLLLLAHGAGAPYTSEFMVQTAKRLAACGLCVVRFHFPYMERMHREGGRRPPDGKKILRATWRAMIDKATKMRNRGPLVIGGKSMGGRIASMIAADGEAPEAHGLVYLGYPLHPPGRPEKLRADHLADVPVPQLFVQGSKDALATPKLLRKALKKIPAARHLEIEGGDHSLARSRKYPMRDADEWLEPVADFVREVTA